MTTATMEKSCSKRKVVSQTSGRRRGTNFLNKEKEFTQACAMN